MSVLVALTLATGLCTACSFDLEQPWGDGALSDGAVDRNSIRDKKPVADKPKKNDRAKTPDKGSGKDKSKPPDQKALSDMKAPLDLKKMPDMKAPLDLKAPPDKKVSLDQKPFPDTKAPLDQKAPPDIKLNPDIKPPPPDTKPPPPDIKPPPDQGPLCGNGKLNTGEQCDKTNFGTKTCATYGHNSGGLLCVTCKVDNSRCFTRSPLANLAVSSAVNGQNYPRAAFNGQHYLVVWSDARTTTKQHIFAARLDAGGKLMDANGFAVSAHSSGHADPAVAAAPSGGDFLVTWTDSRAGSTSDIYGARVSNKGVVKDANGIAISNASKNQTHSDVVYDGSSYMVVWSDMRGGTYSDIYAGRLNSNGKVIDSKGKKIYSSNEHQYRPRIASDGTNHLVVWSRGAPSPGTTSVVGKLVSKSGSPLTSSPLKICDLGSRADQVALDYGGGTFLVAWRDNRSSAHGKNIYINRVSSVGKVLDGTGYALYKTSGDQERPSVLNYGSKFWIAWEQGLTSGGTGKDIYGARVLTTGKLVDPKSVGLVTVVGAQEYPALTRGKADTLLVWGDQRKGSGSDIYSEMITP